MKRPARISRLWPILLLLLFHAAGAVAQEFEIRYLGLRDGLADRHVTAIFHDHNNLVWIGTQSGIYRYDGYEMEPIALPGKLVCVINSIREDPAGRLFFATPHGLFTTPPDRSAVVKLADGWFSSLAKDPRGTIWATADKGIFQISTTDSPPRADLKFAGTYWQQIIPKPDGQLLFYNAQTGTKTLADNGSLQEINLHLPTNLTAWFLNFGNGQPVVNFPEVIYVYAWDAASQTFLRRPHIDTSSAFLPVRLVKSIRRFGEQNPEIVPEELLSSLGMPLCATPDSHGRLWMGAMGGIFIATPRNVQFQHFPFARGQSCRALFQEGNEFYVSTLGKGFFRTNLQTGKTDCFPDLPPGHRFIFSLDRRRLLMGGEYGSPIFFDKKTGRFDYILKKLIGHQLAALRKKNGEIWLAGLDWNRFEPTKNTLQKADTLSGETIFACAEDKNGHTWLVGGPHLLKENPPADRSQTWFSKKLNGNFTCAHVAGDSLWLGTRGEGLWLFDLKTEKLLARLTTANPGNPGNDILNAILPGKKNDLWISTNFGLSQFNPKTGIFVNFSKNDGLENDEFNVASNWRDDKTGHLYFGGLNGVTHFDPALINKQPDTPGVILSKIVRMRGDSLVAFFPDASAQTSDGIRLAAGDRFIEFFLASSDYSDPAQNRFFYRLDGFDRDWISAGKNHVVRFTQLPAGDYLFRVKTVNRDGLPSRERQISLRVEQFFYKTNWFWGLCFCGAAGLMFLGYRYRLQQIHRIFQVRKQIAADLHDDVASSLSHLSTIAKSAKESLNSSVLPEMLTKIESISDESIAKLNDIVWTIDSKKETLHDLVERLQDYTGDFFWEKSVPLDMQVSLAFPEKTLRSEVRHHALLMFKEAVHNIVKHSFSTQVNILFENIGPDLRLRIENRFSQKREDVHSTGRGLENMIRRAEELRGTVVIEQETGFFRVEIRLPGVFV